MSAIRLSTFSGESPRTAKRLLADVQAQAAFNMRLTSGRIDPVYFPTDLGVPVISSKLESIFRMYNSAADFWLSWVGDVDVARGVVAGDTTFIIFFTSDQFEPRVTDLKLATSAPPYPTAWFVLGVTPPLTKPTVTVVGGASPVEDRAYVYTFVTDRGAESAPSPASDIVNGAPDGVWTISNMDVAPNNSYVTSVAVWAAGQLTVIVDSTFGLRAGEHVKLAGLAPAALNGDWPVSAVVDATHFTIAMANPGVITDAVGTADRAAPHNTTNMTKRIYRSVTGTNGTDFYFVKEVPVATTTTVDDVGEDIGEPIATLGWEMPPVDLQGIHTLPSGALVGFSKNELCFSEPLAPYAWPLGYRLATDYPIVAIGTFESNVVVATEGQPYVATGVDPASVTMTRVEQNWPCLSKRGLTELHGGVAWASPVGLVFVGAGGVQNLTEQFYTTLEWRQLAPESFRAAFHDNRYYAAYSELPDKFGIFVLDVSAPLTHRLAPKVEGIHTDAATDRLYVIAEGTIKEWDSDNAARLRFEWWSKNVVVPKPLNLGAARIDGVFFQTKAEEDAFFAAVAAQQAANAVLIAAVDTGGSWNGASYNQYSMNGSAVRVFPPGGDSSIHAVTFELYEKGLLFFSKTIYTNRVFRLPAGKKYDEFSVRLLGNTPVDGVVIGQTAKELETA